MNAEPIELTAPDGVVLRGQHWPGGDIWIVLVHEPGRDLDCWQPLVLPLLERGYSLLTLDLRGHGASDGEWDVSTLGEDLDAMIDFVNQQGARRIGFIGAGESLPPVLLDVHARRLFAIIALSPGPVGNLPLNELRGGAVPKLFVVGSLNEQAVEAEQQLRDRAIGWTVLLRLPTEAQGTYLLTGEWHLHVQENIVTFLEEQRYLSNGNDRSFGTAAGVTQAETLLKQILVPEQQADDAAPSADQN